MCQYHDFLMQILQYPDLCNPENPYQIHGFLRHNLHLLNGEFAKFIDQWTKQTLRYEQDKVEFAKKIGYFGKSMDFFPLGNQADNKEISIAAFQASTQVFTRDEHPLNWGITQIFLANVYKERLVGNAAENLDDGIKYAEQALKVFESENSIDYRFRWATCQGTIANLYKKRIRDDVEKNLEEARKHYQEAGKVFTEKRYPQQWASNQTNLGNLFKRKSWLDKSRNNQAGEAENVELAIQHFNQALRQSTEADGESWANTWIGLGDTYSYESRNDRKENAIECYNQALKVFTKDNYPKDYASLNLNLGDVYCNKLGVNNTSNDRIANLNAARICFEQAFEIYNNPSYPHEYAQIYSRLGTVEKDLGNYQQAYNYLKPAIEMIENSRDDITSSGQDEDLRKFSERWYRPYQRMVKVCLELGRHTEAIEYAERGKTRTLVELLASNNSESNSTSNQQFESISFQDIKLLIGNKRTAIIEWYFADNNLFAFIITNDIPQPEVLFICEEAVVGNFFNTYFRDYYQSIENWSYNLDIKLNQLAGILRIDYVLEHLEQVLPDCNQVIFVPHRLLHLLPLHALPLSQQKGKYLIDKFERGIRYAPSCQLLQQTQQRHNNEFQSLFAVQNPTEDLDYTDLEVSKILPYFRDSQVLQRKHATKAELFAQAPYLNEVNYLHFSCHAAFHSNSPLNSFLLLAGSKISESELPANPDPQQYIRMQNANGSEIIDLSKCLTLGNLFEGKLNLNQCSLVVLSACETGLVDPINFSDEYIGLPSGFILAGSSNVVSSLWSVDDLATSFLLIKFLENLKNLSYANQNFSIPFALNQAQLWLRDATKEDLKKEWISKFKSNLNDTCNGEIRRRLNKKEAGKKPFSSPKYWAAFTVIGK